MNIARKILSAFFLVLKTLRLALPKIGVGWMFALLTSDFNRVSVVELGITAVLVTTLLSVHYVLSPFQVISGRIADRHPIFGYRRTPYLLGASIVGGLLFTLLPTITFGMGAGNPLAYAAAIVFFIVFGVAIAVQGDSHHAMIAEVTTPRTRSTTASLVFTVSIMSAIFSAVVMNRVSPEFSQESMQRLYNLTPFVVIGTALLGVVGLEKRLNREEMAEALAKSRAATPEGNPISVAAKVLQKNHQARGFFAFVLIAILSIFLQDNILEVFGAEVFGMANRETRMFQQIWGGGVLGGMALMGVAAIIFNINKRTITLIGCLGTAFGLGLLAFAAASQTRALINPALITMGFFTGFFNVGALSMMMDMTIEGATGLYMGLWGMAQAFGNGLASVGSGALHTGLIETGLLAPTSAYMLIFGLGAFGMVVAASIMWRLSVKNFRTQHAALVTRADTLLALEVGATA